jgi:PilZ domain
MHEPDNSADKRRHARQAILVEARIMAGEEWHVCRIFNVSAGGAKLQIYHRFVQGSQVRLQIGSFGEFDGTVAWQHGEELGVKFSQSPAEMAEVVIGLATYG